MENDLASLIISIVSLFLALGSVGWTIYRDLDDKPRLRVNISVAEIIMDGLGKQPEQIWIKVINSGKKPIVVSACGFSLHTGETLILKDAMGKCKGRLDPYEVLDFCLPHENLKSVHDVLGKIKVFCVQDTCGGKWHPEKKSWKEFGDSLKKINSSSTFLKNVSNVGQKARNDL